MLAQGQAAFADLQTGIKGYLVNEKKVLVDQATLIDLKSALRILRDDVERSEKRIERLMQHLQNKNKS